jgi:uncharacterized protein YecE (DUF72 family)
MIRIGPAGWSYKVWEGIVYPRHPPKGFHGATYLAQFFDTIEINSSFYRPPTATTVRGLVQKVSRNPKFKFTAKLWSGFTHERSATQQDERAVTEGLDVFAGANRFGALLLQFPWSFRFTAENREYLAALRRRFREYPLVLEVRHISWNDLNALGLRPHRRFAFVAEFPACGFAVELPVDFDSVAVHPAIPSPGFSPEGLEIGDSSLAQALTRK